ncbi:MAG: ATP-dependent Clp protease ATP-binding subunit [Candidatus Peribacteria bacterium]|nr:MAG: ATP-dependent Clp protease ATP-binding subunit [Candidatus Peribacteria bacterium]
MGHDEGGLLTEQVRRRPYSVILLDEIEKASKDVLNILLQILDEGHLKDSKGRWIDFKSTIIVMTSNLGSDEFAKKRSQIGFQSGSVEEVDATDFDRKKERVMDRLKGYLPAELLNRIDHTVVFHPLSKEVMTDIFQKEYATFSQQWSGRDGVSVPKLSPKKIGEIIDKIYDPQLGARPIAKYIHQTIEAEMIEELMK